MLVWILEFFTIYEVAGLQRLVCREFRDAGQERIHERGGRKLFEEFMNFQISNSIVLLEPAMATSWKQDKI